jgi:hypothetical protein
MRRAFRQFLCATAATLVVVAPRWCSSSDESDAAAEGGDGQQSHNWTAIAATLEDVGLGLGAAGLVAAAGYYALGLDAQGQDSGSSEDYAEAAAEPDPQQQEAHLTTLTVELQHASWAPRDLPSRVQRALRRNRAGGLTHVATFVTSGDSATRDDFTRRLREYTVAVAAGSCSSAAGHEPLLELDGRNMADDSEPSAAVTSLLGRLREQSCAASLLLVRHAQAMPSAGSQALEPLLYGEGDRISTRLVVILEVETPRDIGAECSLIHDTGLQELEVEQQRCWVCQQERLQEWLGREVWKRRGFIGRVGAEGSFLPLGHQCYLPGSTHERSPSSAEEASASSSSSSSGGGGGGSSSSSSSSWLSQQLQHGERELLSWLRENLPLI